MLPCICRLVSSEISIESVCIQWIYPIDMYICVFIAHTYIAINCKVSTADLPLTASSVYVCTCLSIINKFTCTHRLNRICKYIYTHVHTRIHRLVCTYVVITTRRLINRPHNRLDRCLRLPQPSAGADGNVDFDANANADSDASAKNQTAQ